MTTAKTTHVCPAGHSGQGERKGPLDVEILDKATGKKVAKTVTVAEVVDLNSEENWRVGREGRCTRCGSPLVAVA